MERVVLIRVFVRGGEVNAGNQRDLKATLEVLDKRMPDFLIVSLEVEITHY